MLRYASFALLLLSLGIAPARAESDLAEFIRANYTKSEHLVPMRDGVRLFTAVYVPAWHHVYRDAARPSALRVGILGEAMPR